MTIVLLTRNPMSAFPNTQYKVTIRQLVVETNTLERETPIFVFPKASRVKSQKTVK